MLETIFAVLVSLASIALIVIVLLQSGKKAGLSGAIAGGSDTYMSKNKGNDLDQILANSTKWIALAWIVLVLVMSLI
jgi:preprotein translocase subunit SecG